MADAPKQNRKFGHVYAIVRYDADAPEGSPIDFRVTVKKVVYDPAFAESEVKRLNALNEDKGSFYFSQLTRLEDVPVEVQNLESAEWDTTQQRSA